MSMTTDNTGAADTIIGVFVLVRHGDMQTYYLSPPTYTGTNPQLTALGETQAFNLGALLQSRYLNRGSVLYLETVNPDVYIDGQALIKASAGTEGSVIINTASALTQGLWPATKASNTTLADGSSVLSPLNGYQYIPIETVDSSTSFYMEGWTSCNTYVEAAAELPGLPDWLTMAQENAAFLESLQQWVGPRPTTFANVYNAYTFMNMNNIHNETFHKSLPDVVMDQVRALANWQEWYTWGSTDPNSILNVAGQTLIPEMLNVMGRLANQGDPLKLAVYTVAYEPFISLFNLLGVAQTHPELAGFVEPTGAVAIEIRKPVNSTDLYVRFNFKNGTQDANFNAYPMFGQADGNYDVEMNQFNLALEPYGIPDTLSWCYACNNTFDRGCDVATQAALADQLLGDLLAQAVTSSHHLSPIASGFIGALVTLVVAAVILAALSLMGLVAFGRRGGGGDGKDYPGGQHHRRSSSIPQIVIRLAKGKRDSGDSESTRGVIKNPGEFEMMPDLPDNATPNLSRVPSFATHKDTPMKV